MKHIKKSILTICILTLSSQSSFATPNRVAALGGETVMITDDDSNIDIFPQQINKQNLLRLSRIDTATPGYAIITGKSGDKWGLYGGTAQQNDFFNLFRSLDANSAVKLGVKVGRYSEENTFDNKEAVPTDIKTTEKNSYYTLAVDGVYGVNKEDQEMSARGVFSYGPNAIASVVTSSLTSSSFGSYEISNTTAATATKTTGEGNQFVFGGTASIRKPMKLAIFNKVFATGSAFYTSNSSSLSTGTVKTEDSSTKAVSLSGRVLMFDEKKIGDKSRVIYGLGGQVFISRGSTKNNVTSTDSSNTSILFTGPQIRLGVESDLKYGTVRFGIQRDLSILSYNSNNSSTASGAVNDENSNSIFSVATGGTYAVSSGFGMQYNNLKIDIVLRRVFWNSGPQLIFDSRNGTIATAADILYTF